MANDYVQYAIRDLLFAVLAFSANCGRMKLKFLNEEKK